MWIHDNRLLLQAADEHSVPLLAAPDWRRSPDLPLQAQAPWCLCSLPAGVVSAQRISCTRKACHILLPSFLKERSMDHVLRRDSAQQQNHPKFIEVCSRHPRNHMQL